MNSKEILQEDGKAEGCFSSFANQKLLKRGKTKSYRGWMYKISAVVEKEGDLFVSHCVELGIASQGNSIEEALENLKEAVELYLEHATPDEIEHLKRAQSCNPILATLTVG
jgi:predicted RNase H-like HicB family nuclease